MNEDGPSQDIRWLQRRNNFAKALGQLSRFIARNELNELEEQGLIKSFEYTYELAWNTLKDFFEDQGEVGINGSRDAFRLAIRRGVIASNGETWMEMIKSRSLTVHTYDVVIAESIAKKINDSYYPEFQKLHEVLLKLSEDA